MSQSLNDDFRSVSISGNIRGGKNTTMQELRDAVIKNDDVVTPTGKNGLYEIAKTRSGMDGSDIEHPMLHRIPMSYTLEENLEEKTINVKAKFDTNPLFVDSAGNESRHFFDYTVDVDTDEITQITKLSVKGKLKVRGLLTERICYIQKFLDSTDLMDFLYKKGKEQYDVIMNVCYKCDSGGQTYWAKATPEQVIAGNAAQAACQGWPPYGNALGIDPELCWKLHPCAESMSVSRNESQGELQLSATFSDTDALMIDSTDDSKGCYDKASFDVTVNNPVEYLKVNASGQRSNVDNDYNGHWAIQKFGIQTRAKSNTKVSLTMRQDSSVISADMENKLRTKAEETQQTLNAALLQNGTEEDYDALKPDKPALVYDINKNISHKDSAAQSITSSLERSYVPEPGGAICVDLPEPNDQKQCFDCRDSSGVKIGGEIYAYQPDPSKIPDEAYDHCDLIAESHCDTAASCWECYEDLFAQGIYHQGLQADALTYCESNALDPDALFSVGLVDPLYCGSSGTTSAPREGFSQHPTTTTSAPSGTTTTAPWHCLTPAICKDCYTCYAIDIPVGDVQGLDMAEAEAECLSQFGVDVNGGDFVFLCEEDVELECYNCITFDDPPITLDPPGVFNALTLVDAQLECDNYEQSEPVVCPSPPLTCWACIDILTQAAFAFVSASDATEALDYCRLEGEPVPGAMNVDIALCDGSTALNCWQCSDGTEVMAYTESVAEAQCAGGLDPAVDQPIGCS
jgi:carbon monoxide dehydrogenase subunit G